jgi:glycosyltransferase 2 family protein
MAPETDDSAPASAPASDAPAADRLARWEETITRRRPQLRRLGFFLSLTIVAVSAIIFIRTLVRIDPRQFAAAFAATSGDQIATAFGLSALSYLALTGYDGLALRHLRVRVPYRLTALASFTSYAVSFTLGFPLVTAGAVRYWIYGPVGLSPGRVASLTIVAGLTFWLGMGFILGVGFLFDANAIGEINHFNALFNQAIGLAILAALAAYLFWVARMRRRRPLIFNFTPPGPLLTLGQMTLGVIDVCSAAGALYVLLPKGHGLGYLTFCTLYSFAAMLGIASHAPGGLGVFEATMINGVGGESGPLLASLLLFRAIYYAAPFILAMALLGAYEAGRRWRSLREALAASTLEAED